MDVDTDVSQLLLIPSDVVWFSVEHELTSNSVRRPGTLLHVSPTTSRGGSAGFTQRSPVIVQLQTEGGQLVIIIQHLVILHIGLQTLQGDS